LGEGTTLVPKIYFVTFHRGYIQMAFFFLALPSGNPKIGVTFIIPKFWLFIYFSNQTCLEHVKAISHSLQKNIYNGAWHAPIRAYLTLAIKEFVVKNQILNLTLDSSFDHNSCISNFNEQCVDTLGIYILTHFQWCLGGPNWCLFSLSTKVPNI
jgi:hypothetical protein